MSSHRSLPHTVDSRSRTNLVLVLANGHGTYLLTHDKGLGIFHSLSSPTRVAIPRARLEAAFKNYSVPRCLESFFLLLSPSSFLLLGSVLFPLSPRHSGALSSKRFSLFLAIQDDRRGPESKSALLVVRSTVEDPYHIIS